MPRTSEQGHVSDARAPPPALISAICICDLIIISFIPITSVTIRSSSVCSKELGLTRHQTKMAGKETKSGPKHVDIELQLQLSELESIFRVIILILTTIDGKLHTIWISSSVVKKAAKPTQN